MKNLPSQLAPALFLSLALIPGLSAAPTVSAVMNAAGNITSTLPNGPLAPGVIFIVKGNGLGPATISIAPKPFTTTTLSGTSVKVTIGTTTVDALMYYTSATQIAALLPSSTPTSASQVAGSTATVVVTYNGQSSPAMQFRGVAANSLHFFTLDSSGQGLAIVTYPDYSLVSSTKVPTCGGPNTACGAANPGDTLILWGTGLGAISGDDAAGAGLGQDMPALPLTLRLGGIQVPIVYRGRSGCCIGEDQVVFTVPANVPTGCAIPLVAQIANQVSNSTVIPVANGGRNCTISDAPTVDVSKFANASSFTYGDVGLEKDFNNNAPGTNDIGYFEFGKIGLQAGISPFLAGSLDSSPAGTCVVNDNSNPGNPSYGVTTMTPLDAGSSISVKGPSSTVTVTSGKDTTLSSTGAFIVPGTFSMTGAGGKDVAAFSAAITVPAAPNLTGPVSGNTFNRNAGLVFTWAGGTTGTVVMEVTAGPDAFPSLSATAHCTASASAGTFTIPGYVMLALPATNNNAFYNFSFQAPNAEFTVPGVDFGTFHVSVARAGGALKLQ